MVRALPIVGCAACLLPVSFAACCGGGASKDSLMFKAHVFFSRTIWASLWAIIKKLLGKRISGWIERGFYHLNYERNHATQAFYFLLVFFHFALSLSSFFGPWKAPMYVRETGSYELTAQRSLMGLRASDGALVPAVPYGVALALLEALSVLSFCLVCWADPGTVPPRPQDAPRPKRPARQTSPPRSAIWPDDRHCETCNVARPPRCHHCRVCNRCVEGFDHHCVWINSDVGQANKLWFLLFLFAQTAAMAYVVALSLYGARGVLDTLGLLDSQRFRALGRVARANRYVRVLLVCAPQLVISALFHAMLFIVLVLFDALQIANAARNRLTYEAFRWDAVRAAVDLPARRIPGTDLFAPADGGTDQLAGLGRREKLRALTRDPYNLGVLRNLRAVVAQARLRRNRFPHAHAPAPETIAPPSRGAE